MGGGGGGGGGVKGEGRKGKGRKKVLDCVCRNSVVQELNLGKPI